MNEKLISKARTIREGFDGKRCYVHARAASNGNELIMTAQYLDVSGCDLFDCLKLSQSRDGGKTWTPFVSEETLAPYTSNGIVSIFCDATPMYHKKTGKFLVIGHTANYFEGKSSPVAPKYRRRITPYAVFDETSGHLGELKKLKLPERYCDCGSGCSQCHELENGDVLIPVSFGIPDGETMGNTMVTVLRCSFDGENLEVKEIGNDITISDSVRGIGEASILFYGERYYLTIRDDRHGYLAVSDDGLNYGAPVVWRFDDSEIVPTYNTQSHWFICKGVPYLVYTRKAETNGHVFRHRAPLFAAEFDTERMALKRETEIVVIPERGARLGNFGAISLDDGRAMVFAAEWMQPVGCEKHGSNNAIWLAELE